MAQTTSQCTHWSYLTRQRIDAGIFISLQIVHLLRTVGRLNLLQFSIVFRLIVSLLRFFRYTTLHVFPTLAPSFWGAMSNVQIRQIGEIDHWVRHRMCKKLTLGHDSAAKKTLSKVARHLAAPGSLRSSPRVLPMSLRCFSKRQADRSLRGTLCPLSLRGASPRCSLDVQQPAAGAATLGNPCASAFVAGTPNGAPAGPEAHDKCQLISAGSLFSAAARRRGPQ